MSLVEFTGGGAFATSRRGGMSAWEVNEAWRLKGLRHGPSSIARILGRAQEDVARLFGGGDPAPRAEAARMPDQPVSFGYFGFTEREARVFDLLLTGRLISDEEIITEAKARHYVDTTYVTTLVRRIRVKTERSAIAIENKKGKGYRLPPASLDQARKLVGAGA